MTEPEAYRGRVETITPEMAVKWLEKNTGNRNLIQSRVDSIAADIREGRWVLTGDPIRFDITGEMIDGQHRLWAIVEADQAVKTYVVRGLPVEAKLVIDTGAKRSLSHYFQITQEPSPALLAGIVNICWQWDKTGWTRSDRGPTHGEAQAYLEEHPQLRDSVPMAWAARRGVGLAPSPMGAAHAINARVDAEASDAFWEKVETGAGLEAGDPILAYRRWAMRVLQARTDRPVPRTQFAHAMKAMSIAWQGRTIRTLSWATGDPMPLDWSQVKKGKAKS